MIWEFPYSFVAIEGNIGAGKTTFAEEISKQIGASLILERFEENPYLRDFYSSREKFAFETEKFFLNDRVEQLKSHFKKNEAKTIADFTIYKSMVFSKITLDEPYQSEFVKSFEKSVKELRKPDLIIHLKNETKTVKERIFRRGRDYEKSINENYLDQIEKEYGVFWRDQLDLNVLEINSNLFSFPYQSEEISRLLKYLEITEIKGLKRLESFFGL